MKAEKMNTKSVDELKSTIADLKKEQFNLRFQKATGELASTGRIRKVRRDIARALTAMNQKKGAK